MQKENQQTKHTEDNDKRELLNSFLNWHDTILGVKANKESNKRFVEEYINRP